MKFIEYYSRPIIFFMLLLQLKNPHVLGLDMEKLGFVVSKWYHDVTMSERRFSAPASTITLQGTPVTFAYVFQFYTYCM
jgi:hypothetical protein